MTRPGHPSALEQIPALLPSLLAGVSIGRTHIIVDQLRGVIEGGRHDEIVLVVLSRGDDSCESPARPPESHGTEPSCPSSENAPAMPPESSDAEPVAVALALTQPPSDAATLLHAGLVAEVAPGSERRLAERVRHRLCRELENRGVRFLQWATDPIGEFAEPSSTMSQQAAAGAVDDGSVAKWARLLDLRPVATLRYLSGKLGDLSERLENVAGGPGDALALAPVQRSDPSSAAQFAWLLQRTYHETLDCQPLSQLRSADQILSAYQHSRAYQDQWWYRVVLSGDEESRDEAIGCLILAAHGTAPDTGGQGERTGSAGPSVPPPGDPPTAHVTPTDPAPPTDPVIELVYMGVVPEMRGRGLGRRLIGETIRLARRHGAGRLILAVDETNSPALEIYTAAGLSPLLRETVWANSLPPGGT